MHQFYQLNGNSISCISIKYKSIKCIILQDRCIGSIILGDITSEAVKIVLTLIAVVALMVPLALTAKIIVLNKDEYVGIATDVVSNVLHDSTSDEEQVAT